MPSPDHIIPTERSTDLVTLTIRVDGSAIPATIGVASVVVYREVNRIPTATLVIFDGDPSNQQFAVSDQDTFIPGKSIEIFAGYHSVEQLIFKGLVTKHSLKLRQTRFELIIECKAPAYRMSLRRRSKTFHDLKDSEVLENILGEYGFSHQVQATLASRPEIVQFDITDWDFLQIRAESNGLLCFVEDENIRVKAPDFTQEPVVRPIFGGSIIAFDAEIDGRTQPETLSAGDWDPANQEWSEFEATEPSMPPSGNLRSSNLADEVQTGAFALRHPGSMPSDELQAFAESRMLRQRMAKLCGRVVFQGKAEVVPGVMIELFGVGERFNGKVFVSGVTQEISGGNWLSHVQFGLQPEQFATTYEIHAPRASGRYGAVNGLSTGVVTQLEGDPNGEGRIRVHLPALNEGDQGVWARVASLDAGNDRGAFFMPDIADEVIVGFLNDDPNNPIVLGMVHSSALPAPLQASDDNHLKGFISRSRIELMFDDEKNALIIKTPGGKTIELDDQSGAINIEDENGNSIKMEASGITVSAAGNLKLEANGMLEIKGSLVKIN